MSAESFRFIHASDFHLERPLSDLDELPDHLRELMVEAPRKAVASIFDAALSHDVDFLVLSGDLIQPQIAGPYGLSLILEGFESLGEYGKQVFWSTGIADDSTLWPESIPMPRNVTVFPKSQTQVISVARDGQPICQLIGRSCEGKSRLHLPDFRVDAADFFRIAVAYGDVDNDDLSEQPFDYWALGGKHQRTIFEHEDGWVASYPGTSQGRSLAELGSHGYQLVKVDANQNLRIQEYPVDSFRYCHVRFDERDVHSLGGMKNFLGERIYHLQNDHGNCHLLIAWELELKDPKELGKLGSFDELLRWARHEYGSGSPSAWSLSLKLKPPVIYPKSWCEEETILGDFLRVTEKYQNAEAPSVNLIPMVDESASIAPKMATQFGEISESNWNTTLQEATRIGVELLRGDPVDGRQHG